MIKWILLVLFLPLFSYAQQNLDEELMEPIEVSPTREDSFSGFWEDTRGTEIFSGKKNTITDLKDIPSLQTNNYRQATSQTPGLLISEIPNEALTAITYRGLGDPHESFNVLLLQDGIPVAADMYAYPAHYYSPPLPMMNNVQFIRGGASLLYGPQPGGVLNYTSFPLLKNQKTLGQANLTYGTYNLMVTNNALYGSKGDHSYGIEYYRRQGDGAQNVNSDFAADYVQIRDYIYKGKNTFRISFNGYDSDHGETGGFAKNPGTNANVFGDDISVATKRHDRLRVSRAQLAAGVEHRINENSRLNLMLWASAYNRFSKRQSGSGFGTFLNTNTNTIVTQKYYGYNGQVRYLTDYKAFGGDHTFTAGYLNYNLNSPLTQESGAAVDSNSGTVTKRINRSTNTNSFFAENRFGFGNFMITPGFRLENIKQSIDERKNTGAPSLRERETTENVPLLGIALSYFVNEDSQIYGNVTEAYKPLTWSDAIPSAANETVAEDIESAKTITYELGYRGESPLLNWDVSAFMIRYENKIGKVGTVYQNSGAGTHKGIDFATEFKLSQIFERLRPLGNFNFYANTSILDAKYTTGTYEGNTPQYAPKSISRAGIIYSKEKQLKVALMGVSVSEHYGDDGNLDQWEIPAYTVFDLTADWNVHANWMLSAGINNLFDEEYYSRVRSDGIIWALDRNFYAGVTYQF